MNLSSVPATRIDELGITCYQAKTIGNLIDFLDLHKHNQDEKT